MLNKPLRKIKLSGGPMDGRVVTWAGEEGDKIHLSHGSYEAVFSLESGWEAIWQPKQETWG